MKKTVSFLLALSLMCGTAVGLTACNTDKEPEKETCTNHVDVNPADGKCDKCGATVEVTPPEDQKEKLSATSILEGIWETPVYGDATHALVDYTAFHDNGVFYHRMQGDRGPDAGNYTFAAADENETLQIVPSNGDPYTINIEAWVTLTTFKGEAYKPTGDSFQNGKYPIAYDETEKAYVLYGMHYGDMRYIHKSDEAHTWDDETAITVDKFTNPESPKLQTVEIGHNGKFTDMATGDYYEGNWSYNATNKTYTLTGDDGTATVKITDNNAYGEYKRGTTELTLDNANFKAEIILKFKGSLAAASGAPCELRVYNNNKYDLYVNGNLNPNGSGTWEKDGDNYKFTSTAVNATTTYADGKYSVTVMGSVLNEVVPENVLHIQGVMSGNNFTIKLKDDNTFTAVMSDYGMTMAEGAWVKDGDNYSLTADAFVNSFQTDTVTLTKTTTGWTFASVGKFIEIEESVTAVFTGKRETPAQEEGGDPTITYLTLKLYENGTHKIVMTEYGRAMVEGNWTVADGVYSLTGFSALGLPLDTLTLTEKADVQGTYTLQAMNLDFKLVA